MSNAAHQERLTQVLLGPHVSEKATALADGAHQVVFRVRPDATKADVRRAVELLFEVKVERVTVAPDAREDEALRSAAGQARRLEEGLRAARAGQRHQLHGRRVGRRRERSWHYASSDRPRPDNGSLSASSGTTFTRAILTRV